MNVPDNIKHLCPCGVYADHEVKGVGFFCSVHYPAPEKTAEEIRDEIQQLKRQMDSVKQNDAIKALKFCRDLASEELSFHAVGTAVEVVLRNIVRKCTEVLGEL